MPKRVTSMSHKQFYRQHIDFEVSHESKRMIAAGKAWREQSRLGRVHMLSRLAWLRLL